MTLVELTKIFASKDILLIRIEDMPDQRDDMVFVGTLDEYLEAIKVLGGRAIFVNTIEIVEEDFAYIPGQIRNAINWPHPIYSHSEEEGEEIYEYDLCSVVPELENYKPRIGEIGYFDLSACHLTYSIQEEWMQNFDTLHTEAQEIVDAEIVSDKELQLAEQEEAQAEEVAILEVAVKKLHALISDKVFVRLPTQLAMRAYAIDNIPELENLDEAQLKREIQDLGAKIQARNLSRNK